MLRLQTKAVPPAVRVAVLSDLSRQVIARIELDARLGRRDIQGAPADRFSDPRRVTKPGPAAQHEIMVVAFAAADLLVVGIDSRADRGRSSKVERRSLDRGDRSGRD